MGKNVSPSAPAAERIGESSETWRVERIGELKELESAGDEIRGALESPIFQIVDACQKRPIYALKCLTKITVFLIFGSGPFWARKCCSEDRTGKHSLESPIFQIFDARQKRPIYALKCLTKITCFLIFGWGPFWARKCCSEDRTGKHLNTQTPLPHIIVQAA